MDVLASIETSLVSRLVGWFVLRWSLILSDFHCVGVSGPSQSVRRPRDKIYFLKATHDRQLSDFILFPEAKDFLAPDIKTHILVLFIAQDL